MPNIAMRDFLVQDIAKLKIAVIGDMMLDRYFYGEVQRISPEAPVPVNRVKKIKSVLGGAANVAHNLACLGCQVYVGGAIGEDANGELLTTMLQDQKIDCTGLNASRERSTITKLRVIGATQQMLRLDFEEVGDLEIAEVTQLNSWLDNLLDQGLDGIIISDYAKGVCSDAHCQRIIATAKAYNIPVLVDPKGSDWTKYSGCSYITPNLKEMCEAAGRVVANEDAQVAELAQMAASNYHIENVVVTRSEKGMTLVGENHIINKPAAAIEVFDVSGAGDTVAATLLAAVAGGIEPEEALELANKAAAVVVSKVGTYPIHREELLKAVLEAKHNPIQGVLTWTEATSLVRSWQEVGDKVVFTNGCFDLLHVGHVTYLAKAAQLGQHLIIGLNTDASVRRLKGETRPLVAEQDRALVLAALGCVAGVVLFDEDTPSELIQTLRPNILVKGGDYRPEEVAGREYVDEVQIIEFEDGYSTTGIVEKITSLVKEGKL